VGGEMRDFIMIKFATGQKHHGRHC
jgi:hypothetical protein